MPMSPNQVIEPKKSLQNIPERAKSNKDYQSKNTNGHFHPKTPQTINNPDFENNKIDEEEEYQPGFLDGEGDNYQIKAKDSKPVSLHHINLSMKSGSHQESQNPDTKVTFYQKDELSASERHQFKWSDPTSSREIEQY